MKVNIINQKDKKVKEEVKKAILKTLEVEGQPKNIEVSVKFVSTSEIHNLNKETRNIDKPTDVLSYPALNLKAKDKITSNDLSLSSFDGKNVYVGDCAICEEIASIQAKEHDTDLISEIKLLMVHSMLHLLGYDHIKDEDYALMHKKEEIILGELKNV